MIFDILDDIKDAFFGNKRLENLRHFAGMKDFVFKRKMTTSGLAPEVKSMDFFSDDKDSFIKGYLFKENQDLHLQSHIFDFKSSGTLGPTTTVFLFYSPQLNMPRLKISPKSSFKKMGSVFSSSEWSDVDKQFDKNFDIKTDDIAKAQSIITIQFAEVVNELKEMTIEANNDNMAIYRPHTIIDIIDMDNIYDAGIELVDIIVNDYGADIDPALGM